MTLAERNAERKRMLDAAGQVKHIQRQFGAVKDGKAVVATETPVMVYDETRRQWVAQVLLMDGVKFLLQAYGAHATSLSSSSSLKLTMKSAALEAWDAARTRARLSFFAASSHDFRYLAWSSRT